MADQVSATSIHQFTRGCTCYPSNFNFDILNIRILFEQSDIYNYTDIQSSLEQSDTYNYTDIQSSLEQSDTYNYT
jgi:hypothetical protein